MIGAINRHVRIFSNLRGESLDYLPIVPNFFQFKILQKKHRKVYDYVIDESLDRNLSPETTEELLSRFFSQHGGSLNM